MMKRLIVLIALSASAAGAQQHNVATIRTSPFVPGESRIYDNNGHVVANVHDSVFIPGEKRVYDAAGRNTGITVRDNPFRDDEQDVYDDNADDYDGGDE